MKPLLLTLRNFLSYHQARLDFRQIHLACICGPNGAGKSSLLDAMAWAVWGQSRVTQEHNLVHMGATEASVEFQFQIQAQQYRIIRTYRRGQGAYLEFQTQLPEQETFRSLTGRSLRDTQARIVQHIGLDYDTFINSAYMRQGRADEFMTKRPSERKQLLADLLQLQHYETLAEAARETSRHYKAQIHWLQQQISQVHTQCQAWEHLPHELEQLRQRIPQYRDHLSQLQAQRQALQQTLQSRPLWQQHLAWQQQQLEHLNQDIHRCTTELHQAQTHLEQLLPLIAAAAEIQAGYHQWQTLQAQIPEMAQQLETHRTLNHHRQRLEQGLAHDQQLLHLHLEQATAELHHLEQQHQACTQLLAQEPEILQALTHLQQARQVLQDYEQRQHQAYPLQLQLRQLEQEQARHTARLLAKMEELRHQAQRLHQHQAQQPQLHQALTEISQNIAHLEKQRVYLQHLQDKGLERRRFMEHLQARQRDCENQIAQLDQKMQLLTVPDAKCPLCQHPLDPQHWALVKHRHEQEHHDLLQEIWVMREQLAVSEREIQVLRREYREVAQQIQQGDHMWEQRGRLAAQLGSAAGLAETLERLYQEINQLETELHAAQAAPTTDRNWLHLQAQLADIHYDEKDHALARGEVDRWRWAERQQTQLHQARQRLKHLDPQLPPLKAKIEQLQAQQATLTTTSPQAQALAEINAQLTGLATVPAAYQHLQAQFRRYHPYEQQWHHLQQAQTTVPQLEIQIQGLETQLHQLQSQRHQCQQQIEQLEHHLHTSATSDQELASLEQEMQHQQQHLETILADYGRLNHAHSQLTAQQRQQTQLLQQLEHSQIQLRLYQELTQAFGANGIPTLIIENLLPQLEADTNYLLERLADGQLQVRFITQKNRRPTDALNADSKRLDTLDIVIAAPHGTRPYETYSGGEVFRVNFALRLALSRLLARQRGSELQLLIIDEGFGTQDQDGCERLVAALNSIAREFACILAITHIPKLQAAFPTQIAVTKNTAGSQIHLIT